MYAAGEAGTSVATSRVAARRRKDVAFESAQMARRDRIGLHSH